MVDEKNGVSCRHSEESDEAYQGRDRDDLSCEHDERDGADERDGTAGEYEERDLQRPEVHVQKQEHDCERGNAEEQDDATGFCLGLELAADANRVAALDTGEVRPDGFQGRFDVRHDFRK